MSAGLPRAVEVVLALVGLAAASPVIALAALAVKLTSAGPVLFRQERVGRGGRPFTLLKLRTMTHGTGGLQVTAGDDRRITAVGRLLRGTKLDELPELWNVLRGEMSFVGPRPEVSRYVDLDDPRWQEVLRARPGITDPVTLTLRDEESVLAAVVGDRDRFYREVLQPYKLEGYVTYQRRRTPWSDLGVLVRTALAVLRVGSAGSGTPAQLVEAVTVWAGSETGGAGDDRGEARDGGRAAPGGGKG